MGKSSYNTKHQDLYREIAFLVKLHRNRAGLTQQQLSELIGVSRAAVANTELGLYRVPLHMLFDIARACGIELIDLMPPPAPLAEDAADDAGQRQSQDAAE